MKWIRNNKKQQAEEINRYIEDPNQTAGLDEETRQVLDSVRQSAEEIRPSSPFVNQLSARLQTAAQIPPSPATRAVRFMGRWTPRLAGAGLGLALIILLLSWLPDILPTQVTLEPAADFDSVVAGQQFTFPDAPAQLPLYEVTMRPVPDTPETAVAWAAAFGLPDPEPFLSPAAENVIFVIGSDGQELTFHHGSLSTISYNSGVTMDGLGGEPPSLEVATAAAIAFLADRELLPPVYHVTDEGALTRSSPVRTVNVDIDLAGQRIDSSMPFGGTTLRVGPDGKIINANFGLLDYTPLEEYVSVQPAEAVYKAFREGRATLFRTDSRIDESKQRHYFMPPPPTYEVGDEVTLTGWVDILVSSDGQTVRATLRDGVTVAQYTLVGESVAALAEEVTVQTSVQVVGRIVAQDGPGRWQVAVAEWQSEIMSSFMPPRCLVGTFDRAEGEGWLLLDEADSGPHLIYQPPDELTGGERIEICLRAEDEHEAADELNWLHIASPPYSETQLAAGSMSMQQVGVVREVVTTETEGSSITSVTEHLVEVGPDAAGSPQPVPTALPVPAGAGVEVEDIAPRLLELQQELDKLEMAQVEVEGVAPILPESPYELGQSVVITGIVQGHFTADSSGQIDRTEVTLLVDTGAASLRQHFPVLADEALLDELLTDNYRRFVSLTGTIVEAPPDQWGTGNQAIALESYHLAWPEVAPRNFLGYISLESFDETQALVFTDKETGQPYILSWDIVVEAYAYMESRADQQQLVMGLVHPTLELGGLPFMYQMGSRGGSDIETAETADQFPVEIEAPVHRQAPDYITRPGQADMVIERMELIYYYEPQYEQSSMGIGQPPQLGGEQIARPVWLIVAHSSDGLMQARYYLEADQR